MLLARSLILKTAALPLIERLVKHSLLFRPLVKRFIAGDTLEQAIEQAEALAAKGFLVSLDYLGENTKTKDEAIRIKNGYCDMLERISTSSFNGSINISIKLTQCGLDQGEAFAEENLRDVLAVAERHGNFVRVDMESSAYTEQTIRIIEQVSSEYKNTGTVLQSYLKRTPEDAKRLIKTGTRVRLVKGAYLEPPEIAFPDKKDVDMAYIEVAKTLLKEGHCPAIATHDESIIKAVKEYADAEQIGKKSFEFQMLYGIRRDLQDSLLAEGYKVRIYVPYGDSWYPYFSRRLAERPANAFFILKSLFKR